MSQHDPVKDILRPLAISRRLKATAWDAVEQATDEADLERRLRQLPLPDDAKAALFEARAFDTQPAQAQDAAPPRKGPSKFNTGAIAFGPGAIPSVADTRPVARAYVQHGPQAVVEGVKDVAQGNYARGARRALSGAAVTAAPAAIPALANAAVMAPVATAMGLGTGIVAQQGVQKGAEALGASEDQAGLAGDIAGIATGGAAAKYGPGAARAVGARLPTKANAGAKFQKVMGAVGDQPVDVSRPGDRALRIYQLSERGGAMPKSVRDFLRRATDPEKGEPTYKEMRDFYSNISRLSADETKRLTPVMRREVGELRATLDKALADVAAKGGQERTYRAAMRQYAIASRIREMAEKTVKYGVGAAGAGAAYSLLKD